MSLPPRSAVLQGAERLLLLKRNGMAIAGAIPVRRLSLRLPFAVAASLCAVLGMAAI